MRIANPHHSTKSQASFSSLENKVKQGDIIPILIDYGQADENVYSNNKISKNMILDDNIDTIQLLDVWYYKLYSTKVKQFISVI